MILVCHTFTYTLYTLIISAISVVLMKFTVTRASHGLYEPDFLTPSPCDGAVLERLEYYDHSPSSEVVKKQMGSVWTIEINSLEELLALGPLILGNTGMAERFYEFSLPHIHLYDGYVE